MERLTIKLAGEEMTLLAERALFWPREATLFVADPHFGKPASFQAAGLPVPDGATATDLARLSACLKATEARQLVILGDFFHTRASRSRRVLDALAVWRQHHSSMRILLVGGNHDRHAGHPPAELNIVVVQEPYPLGPFACCHYPPPREEPSPFGHVLAGHEHPVASLRDVDGSRHRLPCFHITSHVTVLPAFGTFTGGHAIRPRPGNRVFVACEGTIAEARTV